MIKNAFFILGGFQETGYLLSFKSHGGIMRKTLSLIAVLSLLGCTMANAAGAGLAVSSSAASDQGALPVLYTCDGKDVNPGITWSGASDKVQAFALVMADPDAPSGTFYHWVLYNIPKDTKKLTENMSRLPE